MPRLRRRLLLIPILAVTLPTALAGQSARGILERMIAEYDRRAEGIENYTLVQEVMGQRLTTYYEKDTSGAHPIFRPRKVVGPTGAAQDPGRGEEEFWNALPQLLEHAKSGGRETVDGHPTDVVIMDDLADIDIGKGLAPGNTDFTPERGKFYVDPDLWMPRRIVFEGVMQTNGRNADITMTMDLQDIRNVDGLLHPFHTLVRVDGLGQAIDPEMRQKYAEMKKQLADMPESQRQMVEKMMKGQLEQMEQMMSGDGGMNFELLVHEVRVNAGPPK